LVKQQQRDGLMGNEPSSPNSADLRADDADAQEEALEASSFTAELRMADINADPIMNASFQSSMTVSCAKRWLYAEMPEAVAPRWQRWSHGGVDFEDHETFGDAGLEDGAVIYVSMAVVEAPSPSCTTLID